MWQFSLVDIAILNHCLVGSQIHSTADMHISDHTIFIIADNMTILSIPHSFACIDVVTHTINLSAITTGNTSQLLLCQHYNKF